MEMSVSSGDDFIPKAAKAWDWDDSVLISAYEDALGKTVNRIAAKASNSEVNGFREENFAHVKSKKSGGKVKWRVGDYCRAVYVEDRMYYEAEIKEINESEGTCTLKFVGYGNEDTAGLEDLALSRGKSARSRQKETAKKFINQDWRVDDFCRAVYSEDGLLYEGKVLGVFETTCLVKFIGYGNEEEVPLSELQPSGGKEYRLNQLRHVRNPDLTDDAVDDCASIASTELSTLSSTEKSSTRCSDHRPTCGINCPPNSQRQPQNLFVPPAPIPFPSNPDLPVEDDHLSAMLMSWYMAGYHTGYYQAKANLESSSPRRHDTHSPSCDGNYQY